uniref:Protein trichome birefringence-like 42 n=1 Tax=Nicotiana sylvestris TaxID=4096 RepID=A0A1U7YBU1_NICSY|nr:PREDICTED: protein trichome birefringence-like 42 [Nicotiana sylvestris]
MQLRQGLEIFLAERKGVFGHAVLDRTFYCSGYFYPFNHGSLGNVGSPDDHMNDMLRNLSFCPAFGRRFWVLGIGDGFNISSELKAKITETSKYNTSYLVLRDVFLVDIISKNNGARVLMLDSLSAAAQWKEMDVLIFDSWHWYGANGHPSTYGFGGHRNIDCTHWCVAGVADTWNLLLGAVL